MSFDTVWTSPEKVIMGSVDSAGAETFQTLTADRIASSIVNVSDVSWLTLFVKISAGDAANILSIFPLGSGSDKPPATAIVDEWYIASVVDGTVVAGTPGGTLLSGADFTLAPAFGQVTIRPFEGLTVATAAGTDKIRLAIPFWVHGMNHFHVQIADTSGAGTLADVMVRAVGSVGGA